MDTRKRENESATEQLLTRAMLVELVPVTAMSLWRWIKKGTFPRPIVFNRRNYWRQSEIQAWIEGQSRKRADPTPAAAQ